MGRSASRLQQRPQPDRQADALLPVGSRPAGDSPFGLHDMAGGVAEWTRNWWDTDSASDQTGPTGPMTGGKRVLRDGAFTLDPFRSAHRRWIEPDAPVYSEVDSLGMRCVRTVP